MPILLVSAGTVKSSATPITPTFGQSTTAGDLLICGVIGQGANSFSTSSSGWSLAVQNSTNSPGAAIFWKPNCGTGETAPSITGTGTLHASLSEWSGAALSSTLDQTGTGHSSSSPLTTTNSLADTAATDLVIVVSGWTMSVAGTGTYSTTSFTDLANSGSTSGTHSYDSAYQILTSGGVSADSAVTSFTASNITAASGAIASFFAVGGGGEPDLLMAQMASY